MSTTTRTKITSEPPHALDPTTPTPKPSWLGYLWDTADVGVHERRMLFKVDASLLLFASVCNPDLSLQMESQALVSWAILSRILTRWVNMTARV